MGKFSGGYLYADAISTAFWSNSWSTRTHPYLIMGLVVAMLSVTGVYIWWKKRRGRAVLTERTRQAPNTVVT
ncbi:protein of unknown function [Candidatus Nitrotoga arctica]|uniref:LPXTG-motif cell wall anchor domain-containing protein n=1 Tax=Candidatus Nitrotoga arctica TaxID=453162 RepID=A0ABN8AHN4_9PROT|nr:protein of unknown function [Candidatus Nitrotoga arctica]